MDVKVLYAPPPARSRPRVPSSRLTSARIIDGSRRARAVPELVASDRGPGYHQLEGSCAAAHHVVIGDRGGNAFIHPR